MKKRSGGGRGSKRDSERCAVPWANIVPDGASEILKALAVFGTAVFAYVVALQAKVE
jgi:hypothetical protein